MSKIIELPYKKECTVEDLLKDFIEDLDHQNCSKHTIKNYLTDLKRFAKFYQGSIKDLSTPILRKYFEKFPKEKYKSSTIARYHSSINTFLEWCFRQEIIDSNPIKRINPPKLEEPVPRAIPLDDFEKIMKVVDKSEPWERLLFTMLSELGMRVSEALALRRRDIDISEKGQEKIIINESKNKSGRIIPLAAGQKSLLLLRKYLRSYPGDIIFFSDSDQYKQMCYGTVLKHWRALLVKAGLKEESIKDDDGRVIKSVPAYRIHQLRHTCFTSMINNGMSPGSIRQIAGHRNMQTTMRYAQLNEATVRDELNNYVRKKNR